MDDDQELGLFLGAARREARARRHDAALRCVLPDLSGAQRTAQLHLLTCPDCREAATAALQKSSRLDMPAEPGCGERDPGADARSLWYAFEELAALPECVEPGTGKTRNLLAELLDQPARERRKLLRQPRFHSADLLELLLHRARASQPKEPAEAEALALLAGSLARYLQRNEREDDEAALSLTRADYLAGNARRLLGQWANAEESLSSAAHSLPLVQAEPWERITLCRYLGLLRWEEGRLVEAEALLRQAVRDSGEIVLAPSEEAISRALLGLLILEGGRPAPAALLLQASRAALVPSLRPWLTARAGLGLALALADVGEDERARRALAETLPQCSAVDDEPERARLKWMEGRLHARLGAWAEAVPLLEAARRHLLAESCPGDVFLCSFDLALVLGKVERGADVCGLFQEIEAAYRVDSGIRGLLQAAGVVDLVTYPAKFPHRLATETASLLRRMLRLKGYRAEGLPFV